MTDEERILEAIDIMADGHEKVLLTRYAELVEYDKTSCQFILERNVSFMNNGGVMKAINFLTLGQILDRVDVIGKALDKLVSNGKMEFKDNVRQSENKMKDNYQPKHTVLEDKQAETKGFVKMMKESNDAKSKEPSSSGVSDILKSIGA